MPGTRDIPADVKDFAQRAAEAVEPKKEIPRHLRYTVFPIYGLRKTGDSPGGPIVGDPKLQGTAAMLTRDGLFLTAGHCVNHAFGEKDITGQNEYRPTDYTLHVFNLDQAVMKICKIFDISISEKWDVAIGRAEWPGKDSEYPYTLGIATNRIEKGGYVFGIGYPNTVVEGEDGGTLKVAFNSRYYEGRVGQWRRDLIPWGNLRSPGYEHSVSTDPGFSGGPLIRKSSGMVHGVMVGGYSFGDSAGGIGHAVDLKCVVDEWVVPILGNMTLREFARKNPRTITIR